MGILKSGNVKLQDYKKQEQIEQNIKKLIRNFFFYNYDNKFDMVFENQYIQNKYIKAQQIGLQSSSKQSKYLGMIFTLQNIKRYQNIINNKVRDFDYYDDFLPLYFPGNFDKQMEQEKFIIQSIEKKQKSQKNIIKKLSEKFVKTFGKMYVAKVQNQEFNKEIYSLFIRLENLIESIEMNNVLEIPPDFFIQNSLFDFHLWLIWSRLSEFKDHPKAQAFCCHIDAMLQDYIFKKCHAINTTSKQNTLFQELQQILENNKLLYRQHFLQGDQTMHDPLYKADAMVYLCIFQHKVDRYDDKIYKMAYYCVEAFQYFKTLNADQILNQEFDFNVFKVAIDYKEQLLIKNPQLSPEEFERELKRAPEDIRKFDYVYQQEKIRSQKDFVYNEKSNLHKYALKIKYLANKFKNLNNYDIYEEREALEQQRQTKRDKYAWKIQLNNKDDSLKKEFNPDETRIQKINIANRIKSN